MIHSFVHSACQKPLNETIFVITFGSVFFLQIFQGNSDRYFVVVHRLRPTIKARYIRIHPRTWYSYIAMRIELYGCRLGENSHVTKLS